MNAILADRIRNAAQVVLEYGGISFALTRAERDMLIAALQTQSAGQQTQGKSPTVRRIMDENIGLQANIDRGLSLVADLERLGTIDSAVSAELQIALGGGYPASPLPEDERTAHKTELG